MTKTYKQFMKKNKLGKRISKKKFEALSNEKKAEYWESKGCKVINVIIRKRGLT